MCFFIAFGGILIISLFLSSFRSYTNMMPGTQINKCNFISSNILIFIIIIIIITLSETKKNNIFYNKTKKMNFSPCSYLKRTNIGMHLHAYKSISKEKIYFYVNIVTIKTCGVIYNLQTAVASSFSSNNSLAVTSNLLRENSSISKSWTIFHCLFSIVTGNEKTISLATP